jgi:hypothetical protein
MGIAVLEHLIYQYVPIGRIDRKAKANVRTNQHNNYETKEPLTLLKRNKRELPIFCPLVDSFLCDLISRIKLDRQNSPT